MPENFTQKDGIKWIYTVRDLASSFLNCSELSNKKVACLTLDVEQDYGDLLEEPSYEGLDHVPEFVDFFKERDIPLTCFVQGLLFETHQNKIDMMLQLNVIGDFYKRLHKLALWCIIPWNKIRGLENSDG